MKSIEAAQPEIVAVPTGEVTDEVAAAVKAISEVKTRRDDLQSRIEIERVKLARLSGESAAAGLLRERLARLAREVATARAESRDDAARLGLQWDNMVRFELQLGLLDAKQQQIEEERKACEGELAPAKEGSLPQLLESADQRIAQEQAILDEPHRRYQKYQDELANWKQRRSQIIGDEATPGSIVYVEKQILELGGLPTLLDAICEERRGLSKEIHSAMLATKDLLTKLYAPVQRFIDESPVAKKTMQLSFYATLQDLGFAERFLDMIHQGRIGSFAGKEEGEKEVAGILARYDFEVPGKAIEFAEEIVRHLRTDLRDPKKSATNRIIDQLKASRSAEELYDYLFGFSYLGARYGLLFGDRELHELSPGEKGALLLVFYLLVDRAESPLLIDQPEENLDNETIFSLLVPSIRVAKNRRQVIIVTHNPNLAVVCDADQVVSSVRDSEYGTRITYKGGAIENPVINRRVVDILEGTRPALDNRNAKYF